MVHPAIHDHGRTVGGDDELHVGIELQNEVDELLLPFKVQAHLGLIHEQHIGELVFHQHGEQNHQHLFFTTRELIGQQHFAHLIETYLVFCAHNGLSCFCKKAVNEVLKQLFRGGIALRFGSPVRRSALQSSNHLIAHIHLIIQIFALQLKQLPVQFGGQAKV